MIKKLFTASTLILLAGCGSNLDEVSNLQITDTAKEFSLGQLEVCAQFFSQPENFKYEQIFRSHMG